MEFILFIAFVFLLVSYMRLQARLDSIERKSRHTPSQDMLPKQQHTYTGVDHGYSKEGQGYHIGGVQIPIEASRTSLPTYGVIHEDVRVAPPEGVFIAWLKEDFLMKLGGLFLLMGLGWFVSLAFTNGWIGPVGRISLGVLFGVVLLILGTWRIRSYPHQGAIFAVLGSTTILLTLSAARYVYEWMISPFMALLVMFTSIVFVSFLSIRYDRKPLAIASLILAAAAPHLIHTPVPQVFEHFLYLLLIVSGTLWVVYYKLWRILTSIALTIVFFETLPYLQVYGTDLVAQVLLWVFLFVGIFFIANIVSIIRMRGAELMGAHIYTAFLTAFFLIIWVFTVAPKEWQSLLFVLWMLVFAVGAYAVYRATDNRIPFYVYGATSIALLASATAAELEGELLTIAFTFEIGVLVVISEILRLDRRIVDKLCLLFFVPGLMTIENFFDPVWLHSVFHKEFFTLVTFALICLVVGVFLAERRKAEDASDACIVPHALSVVGSVYLLMLVRLIFHALLTDDVATACTLIVYTIIGIALFVQGRATNSQGIKIAGLLLIGVVVAQLIFVEVWDMALTGRVITFISIGVLLLSTAFMNKRSHQ